MNEIGSKYRNIDEVKNVLGDDSDLLAEIIAYYLKRLPALMRILSRCLDSSPLSRDIQKELCSLTGVFELFGSPKGLQVLSLIPDSLTPDDIVALALEMTELGIHLIRIDLDIQQEAHRRLLEELMLLG